MLFDWNITTVLQSRFQHYYPFLDKKITAQRGRIDLPKVTRFRTGRVGT